MSIATKAIAEIESADEAGMVAHQIMRHFGLVGTVFVPEDIRSRLSDHEVPEDEREGIVSDIMSSGEWRYINDRTTEIANEIVDDAIIQRVPELVL